MSAKYICILGTFLGISIGQCIMNTNKASKLESQLTELRAENDRLESQTYNCFDRTYQDVNDDGRKEIIIKDPQEVYYSVFYDGAGNCIDAPINPAEIESSE